MVPRVSPSLFTCAWAISIHAGGEGEVDVRLGQAPVAAVGAHDAEVVGEGEHGAGGEDVPLQCGHRDDLAGRADLPPSSLRRARQLTAVSRLLTRAGACDCVRRAGPGTGAGVVTQGVEEQVVDLGGGCLDRGGARLGPAHDHRAFDRGDDTSCRRAKLAVAERASGGASLLVCTATATIGQPALKPLSLRRHAASAGSSAGTCSPPGPPPTTMPLPPTATDGTAGQRGPTWHSSW